MLLENGLPLDEVDLSGALPAVFRQDLGEAALCKVEAGVLEDTLRVRKDEELGLARGVKGHHERSLDE